MRLFAVQLELATEATETFLPNHLFQPSDFQNRFAS